MQRRFTFVVFGIDLGVSLDKELRYVDISSENGAMQWSLIVLILRVDIC